MFKVLRLHLVLHYAVFKFSPYLIRTADGNGSSSEEDVKEGGGGARELTSAEEMQILTREMAGFLSRL